MNGVQIGIDPELLKPVIREIVSEVLAKLEETRGALPDKLAYSEPEAARLLSLQPHQLRDERPGGG